MANGDDVLQEFLAESYENLDRLDRELVELEKTPDAEQILSSIFRTIHTIKGTSGFFGFSKLGELTHVGENLLSKMRDGELRIDGNIASALLQMVDAVREMLASIGACHDEGEGDYSAIAARLAQLLAGEAAPAVPAVAAAVAPTPVAAVAAPIPVAAVAPTPVAAVAATPVAVVAAVAAVAAAPAAPKAPSAPAAAEPVESSIRVDTTVLDDLMNLAGEMVLARNELMQIASSSHDPALAATCQRLSLITAQMQEGVMRTRMQPIGNLLAKLPRVVRDLAVSCGKEVAIEIEGKDTDLDRTVLEAIKDPLTHLIRNSVDHGIETPAVRLRAGKPAQGLLRVRAFHEGGQVHIEIIDDGGGIDSERVKAKAVERGLISAAEAQKMSERDAVNLIFLAGLSTAEKVTSVSGRGVGMDVVKTNVQRIGGHIDVQSTRGVGTCLRIKIPLTLAIIPALIVTCDGDRYAIPQLSVRELVRIDRDAERVIEHIHGAPVHRLRGQLLPLVDLGEILHCASPTEGPIHVVVLDVEGCVFGLVVDQIKDTDEIVVKPLERQMKGVGPYSGATILGDGRVALILDARALAQRAHLFAAGREPAAAPVALVAAEHATQTLLVIKVGDGRAALPLQEVARLEEFAPSDIERAGGREVVQYRGRLLPLLRVAEALCLVSDAGAASLLHVVVHTDASGASIGLVVDGIVDVVQERIALQPGARVAGVLGTAIVSERATELLDLGAMVRSAGLGGM